MWLALRALGRVARECIATDTELPGGKECGTLSPPRPGRDEARAAPTFPTLRIRWILVEGTRLESEIQRFLGEARFPLHPVSLVKLGTCNGAEDFFGELEFPSD